MDSHAMPKKSFHNEYVYNLMGAKVLSCRPGKRSRSAMPVLQKYKARRIYDFWQIPRLLINRINHFFAKKNLEKFNQMAIFSFDHIGLHINLYGIYERQSLEAIRDFIVSHGFIPNSAEVCAVDVGANIGNHSTFFAQIFKHVYAYEPNPRTFQLLKFNCYNRNISSFNFGLSDDDGVLKLQIIPENIGSSAIISHPLSGSEREIVEVSCRSLDGIAELKEKTIGLIKIDVEGHEAMVIRGAHNLITRNKPVILFEQLKSEFIGGTTSAIEEIRKFGYRFFIIEENFRLGDLLFFNLCSKILRFIFGSRVIIREVNIFEHRSYEMIIAVSCDNDHVR
jgi:FkbM family methyltransferase